MPRQAEQLRLLNERTTSRTFRRQTCRSISPGPLQPSPRDPGQVDRQLLAELVQPIKAGELGERTGLGALFLAGHLEDMERRGLIKRGQRGVWGRA